MLAGKRKPPTSSFASLRRSTGPLFDSIDEGFCVIEVLFDDADNALDLPLSGSQSGL
jgi:hypothetical protein